MNHGLSDYRVELPELSHEALQVDGTPCLEHTEDAVQHDHSSLLLSSHQFLSCAINDGNVVGDVVLDFLEPPRRLHADYVIVLMPV